MTIKDYRPLNRAPEEYQEYDESMSRRTIEQNFQDVGSDIHSVKVQADRDRQPQRTPICIRCQITL